MNVNTYEYKAIQKTIYNQQGKAVAGLIFHESDDGIEYCELDCGCVDAVDINEPEIAYALYIMLCEAEK